MRRLGLNPLENARTELPHFDLAGVNDVAGEDEGQGPDYAKALGDRTGGGRACCSPTSRADPRRRRPRGRPQLSGTPWRAAVSRQPRGRSRQSTLAGLDRYGDTQLYVSRGAGAWGPPTRVGAPSDITVIELASKQA
ncbi:hypothetical protein GCM10023238_12000 [Streptomyces heliomycini]